MYALYKYSGITVQNVYVISDNIYFFNTILKIDCAYIEKFVFYLGKTHDVSSARDG